LFCSHSAGEFIQRFSSDGRRSETVQFGSHEYQLVDQCKRKIDWQSPINATCDVSEINGLSETKLLSGFSLLFFVFIERQRPALK